MVGVAVSVPTTVTATTIAILFTYCRNQVKCPIILKISSLKVLNIHVKK